MLVVLLLALGLQAYAHASEAGSNNSRHPAPGSLKVWVPAGMVGNNYWIYINGRIVDAPPHGTTSPARRDFNVVPLSKGDGPTGWAILNAQGLILKMHHEDYDDLISYIDSASLDPLHLFQEFDLSLPPGKYTVEVAFLSEVSSAGSAGSSISFPFVITRKYVADINTGQTTRLYPGVPDKWSTVHEIPALAARRLCPEGAAPSPPDDIQFQRWVKEYLDDPTVRALHGADAFSKHFVVLDLPPALGGERDFDGSQIRYIANAISARHNLPDHAEVAVCMNLFPQFSQSYAGYDKMISATIGKDFERFQKLASDLETAGH
jgi:hypothetical protein